MEVDTVTPLHLAAGKGHREIVKFLLEIGANVEAAQSKDGQTPLHLAAGGGYLETVKVLMEMPVGGNILALDGERRSPLHSAERFGHDAVVSCLSVIERRSKSTTAPVVDPAARAAAEAAAAAMAALLIAEEEDQKQAPPSKEGNSNKARKKRNRKKANPDELGTGSKGLNEAIGGSVASSSGMTRDYTDDGMGRTLHATANSIETSVNTVERRALALSSRMAVRATTSS
jgi:ankyrin repeat protein